MSKDVFSFVVYTIHACARKWKETTSAVYRRLKETGCIDDFLVPSYDVLHTQSTSYIVSDVERYLELHGTVL